MAAIRALAAVVVILAVCAAPGMALAWHPETVDDAGAVGTHTSLALLSSGEPAICYYRAETRDLRFAWRSGRIWKIQIVDSAGSVGKFCSLAIDSADAAHISYYDQTNGELKYATNATGSWVTDVAHADSGDVVGQHTSIAVDGSDVPHIAYLHVSNGRLYYATPDGLSWDTDSVDTGDVGRYAAIAVEADGTPHISYYEFDSGNLRYATKSGASWSDTTVDSSGDVGSYTSIALTNTGSPRISYWDVDDGDLKYAKFGSSWSTETVVSADNVGRGTSIAIDGSNLPHIAYYASTGRDIRVARFDGALWGIETVDADGRVGQFPSFALGAEGLGYVSYYDETNEDLRFATQSGGWLSYASGTGYDDGLKPNTGEADSTKFKFRVVYQDPRGWAPQLPQVLVQRNGVRFATWNLRVLDPIPSWINGATLWRTKKLPAGDYEFRFRARDLAGAWAGGEPGEWHAGPSVTDGPLGGAIVSVAAAPTNVGAQISVNLSSSGSVDAHIVNMAGRPVKTLVRDKGMESGLNTLIWNGADERGLTVPSGRYVVRVRARSESGETTHAVCPVPLQR